MSEVKKYKDRSRFRIRSTSQLTQADIDLLYRRIKDEKSAMRDARRVTDDLLNKFRL